MISEQDMALWWLALAVLLVVALVVAGLLYLLHGRAREIDRLVGAIWQAGQRVANNTVHIPQLYRIADGVDAILAKAGRIAGHAAAIEAHAARCPGCPQCIWRK
jgi:hypothetical protein